MKRSILILTVCLFLVNCKHQISRIGYRIDKKSPAYADCGIPIKKHEKIPDSVATKIGSIWLADTGFSNKCSEADATVILRKEGCALDADFINITNEGKPDEESVCYRCKADLYKFKE